MSVLINNNQSYHRLPVKKIINIAQLLLNILGCPNVELSIFIVDDFKISELSNFYLNKRIPTNVLSFSMLEVKSNFLNNIIGDVVISINTTNKEAINLNITLLERFVELLIHGILHLLGYNHDKSKIDFFIMESYSEELFLNIKHKLL